MYCVSGRWAVGVSTVLPWFFFVPLFCTLSLSRMKTWLTDNSEWRTVLINHPSLIRTTEKLPLFTFWSIHTYTHTYYVTTLCICWTLAPEERQNFCLFFCVCVCVCSAQTPLPRGEKPVTTAFEDHDIQHFFLSLPVASVSWFDCSHHWGEWPLLLSGPVWLSGWNTVEHYRTINNFFCLINPNSNIVWKSLICLNVKFDWMIELYISFEVFIFDYLLHLYILSAIYV